MTLRDYRCPNCQKLLLRARLIQGCLIEIRCVRCKQIVYLDSLDGPKETRGLTASAP